MARQFNVGDVVRLKHGGPDMTIVHIIPDWSEAVGIVRPGIHCVWFLDTGEIQKSVFQKEVLALDPSLEAKEQDDADK